MNNAVSVSCIVPAYNEAPRIGAVLKTALLTPGLDEVIVIDDGSTDGTPDIVEGMALRAPRLRLIRQPGNGGKARAVQSGVSAATTNHVLLLDSDLVGLTPAALTALLRPVTEGHADAAISLRRNAPKLWHLLGLDYISGERVMPRHILANNAAEMAELPGFGLEVWMNRLWIAAGFSISVVHWPGVSSPMKHEKRGRLAGIGADIDMLRDMFRTISPISALAQIHSLRRRRVGLPPDTAA